MALQKQGTDHVRNPGQPGGRLPRETSTHFGSLKDLCTPSGMPGSLPKSFHSSATSFSTPGTVTVIRRVRAILNPSRTTISKLSRPVPSLPSWSARGTRVLKARLCPQGTPPFQLYNSILVITFPWSHEGQSEVSYPSTPGSRSVSSLAHANPGKGLLDRARYRLKHTTDFGN